MVFCIGSNVIFYRHQSIHIVNLSFCIELTKILTQLINYRNVNPMIKSNKNLFKMNRFILHSVLPRFYRGKRSCESKNIDRLLIRQLK